MKTEFETESSSQITIISVTKNDLRGIKRTVQSIESQDYYNWRLIIVLSNENDESFTFGHELSEGNKNIHLLIPESLGIYQAMNSALDVYNPGYTWFLNGGDVFANGSVLRKASKLMNEFRPSVLIGGYRVYENGKTRNYIRSRSLINPRKFSLNIRSGNHQSMLFDLGHTPSLRFNTDLRLAADFEMVLELLKTRVGLRVPEVFAEIEPGGISSYLLDKTWAEKQDARQRVFGRNSTDYLLGHLWTDSARAKRAIKNFFGKN